MSAALREGVIRVIVGPSARWVWEAEGLPKPGTLMGDRRAFRDLPLEDGQDLHGGTSTT